MLIADLYIHVVMGSLLFFTSLFMIFLILIQRGRGGGLAGALGGSGGSSAFGAKAGDTFTRVTAGMAIFWFVLCLLTIMFIQGPRIRPSTEKETGIGAAGGSAAPATDGAGTNGAGTDGAGTDGNQNATGPDTAPGESIPPADITIPPADITVPPGDLTVPPGDLTVPPGDMENPDAGNSVPPVVEGDGGDAGAAGNHGELEQDATEEVA